MYDATFHWCTFSSSSTCSRGPHSVSSWPQPESYSAASLAGTASDSLLSCQW